MTRLVAPDHLWCDGRLQPGLAAEIGPEGIRRVRPLARGETPDARPHLLMPACADLQVNGSGGVMMNNSPTPEAVAHIVATQRRLGTGWTMPTLITSTAQQMAEAADAVIAAWGLPGLLGLHLEGPHLNPARKGTHDAALIRPLDLATIRVLERLRARAIPTIFTLAPEVVPDAALREIVAMGVVVSIGHTAASAAEARAGLAAGARMFTHLFNAMPPMLSRAPGTVAAALNSEAHVGLIADGHHVAWEMLAIACRARPLPGRTFLVSDAMATVGGPERFTLYGEEIAVREGCLVNAAGALAGAHVDLLTSLRNVTRHVGLPLAEAVAMVTDIPHQAIGARPPSLRDPLNKEEIVALDADLLPIAL